MKIFKFMLLVYLGPNTKVIGNDEINELSKVFSNGLKYLAKELNPDSGLNIVQSIGRAVLTHFNEETLAQKLEDLVKSLPTLDSDTGMSIMQSILKAASPYHLNEETFAQKLEDLLKPLLHMDSDTGLSFSEFVNKYNYVLESHEVTTEDGYILTLHRIPHHKPDSIKGTEGTSEENVKRPVVLLVHALVCSSGIWIWQGPNASLPFQLVDQGYDVWLANARGNSYSDKHVVLTTKQPQFWNFSFHEIGYYDMASSIDYILNVTEVEKITYVGHSQGTTAAAVLLSSRPEYNEKLNLVVMFSPVVYLTQVRSPIVQAAKKNNELIKRTLELVRIYAFERSQFLDLLLYILCNEKSPVQGLCIVFVELIVGFDVEQIETSKLPVFFTFTPSGAPYKTFDHYVQGMYSAFTETRQSEEKESLRPDQNCNVARLHNYSCHTAVLCASGMCEDTLQSIWTRKFRQFDYVDPGKNFEKYGSSVPPSYDIAKISAPVAAYYSKNDYSVIVDDAERFVSELRTEIADQYLIRYDKFNHLDFVMAKDVKKLLYDRVVGVVKKYNPLPGN